MKSKMRVDFKGLDDGSQSFEPVIRIELQDSEDVRDGLLKAFFEKLGGESNWLSVDIQTAGIAGEVSYITLHPIKPQELRETVDIINTRIPKKYRFKGKDVYCSQGTDTFLWVDHQYAPHYFSSQEEIDNAGLRD